jgi:hypothetical protein
MNRFCCWLVDLLSRPLAPDERDAVRGDFAESGESAGQALRGLIGLVVRRQIALWRDWRPWMAPVGLVAPVALVLSQSSSGPSGALWIGWQLRTIWTHGVRYEAGLSPTDDIVTLFCAVLLPIVWAGSGGFVLGFLSRRNAWVHPALLFPLLWLFGTLLRALLPGRLHAALFWLLPPVVLILIPFLWGVHLGVRGVALQVGRTAWLAGAIAILTLVMQVEDGRSRLAFAAWSSGGALDGRLVWIPRLLPFAAILWQFGFIFTTTRFKESDT